MVRNFVEMNHISHGKQSRDNTEVLTVSRPLRVLESSLSLSEKPGANADVSTTMKHWPFVNIKQK